MIFMYSNSVVAVALIAAARVALADTPPVHEQLAQRCLPAERALLLLRLGTDPRLPTRESVEQAATIWCEQAVRGCRDNPSSDDCRSALSRHGLGEGRPVPATGRQLFDAAYHGQADVVVELLTNGADVNWQNVDGWTPVMIAAAERHAPTVARLLASGADPNRRNRLGRTPLMFAARYGDTTITRQLLAAGAQMDIMPSEGKRWTALMVAAAQGHADTVRALLEAGAKSGLVDDDGHNALDLARAAGHTEVIALLSAR